MGPEIAGILAAAGGGARLMPLVKTETVDAEFCKGLNWLKSLDNSVLSGLCRYLGCWDAAHALADSIENPNGYFWHAMVDRLEPDPENAAFWYRRTGRHPISPGLAVEWQLLFDFCARGTNC